MPEELYNKFILIDDGEKKPFIVIGRCVYHRELLMDVPNKYCKGGGWYEYNFINKSIKLFGDSTDFGTTVFDEVNDIIQEGEVYASAIQHRKFPMCNMTKISYTHEWDLRENERDKIISVPEKEAYV